MPFKVVVYFENGKKGWQEVYYSAGTTLTQGINAGNGLIALRTALMGGETSITGMRVQDAAMPRVSRLFHFNFKTTGKYQSLSDFPDTAALMLLYSNGDNRRRPLYLRGNPDSLFDDANPNNADQQMWLNNYALFGNFLQGQGPAAAGTWLIRKRVRPQVGVNTIPITTWAAAVPSTLTNIVLDGNVPLVQGSFLQTYHVKGLPFAPGLVEVVSATPGVTTSAKILYRTPSDYIYDSTGYAILFAATFDTINDFDDKPLITRRATGRPFELSRGRRRSILR